MISSFDKWSGCLLNKVSQQLMIVGWYIFLGLTSISISFMVENVGCFGGMLIVAWGHIERLLAGEDAIVFDLRNTISCLWLLRILAGLLLLVMMEKPLVTD